MAMFRYEEAQRSDLQNQILAGFLALVAGLVNSAGFVLIGSFSSHVTGNVGRLANDIALGKAAAAGMAIGMIVSFFAGAVFTSMVIETNAHRSRPHVYAALMFCEAGLLAMFYTVAQVINSHSPRIHDVQALVLCASMGLQNSLVTRLSGAVIRTTHLTGVVTDLGIEAARWLRHWQHQIPIDLVKASPPAHPVLRPNQPKTILLLTVLVTFVFGSVAGSLLAVYAKSLVFLVPISLLVAGGAFGMRNPKAVVNDLERK